MKTKYYIVYESYTDYNQFEGSIKKFDDFNKAKEHYERADREALKVLKELLKTNTQATPTKKL